jgi:hypothetical protein
MGKSKTTLALGIVMLVVSATNKAFGWFRSIDYLQRNAPSVFAFINTAAFQITLMVIGLVCAAAALYEIRRGKAAMSSGVANPPKDPTSTATGRESVAAAVGSIGVIEGGATVIVGTGTHPKEPPKPVATKPNGTRPNLNYCGFRKTDVFISPWAFAGIQEPTSTDEMKNAIPALLLKFENDLWPDNSGKKALNVLAQAVYRSASGSLLRIDYAPWLSAGIRFETIDIGDTRELVLLVMNEARGEGNLECLVFNDRRDLNEHFPEPFSWFRNETIIDLLSAQVTIVEVNTKSKYVFDFDITVWGDGFNVSLKTFRGPGQAF